MPRTLRPHPGSAPKSPTLRGPEPRQDRAVRTRAQVLEAAAVLFAERGFRGTNVQDVAAQVSMTKGAVYFHFPNKDSLAVGVVEEHYARWPVLLDRIRTKNLAPLATVEELFDRAARAFRDDPVIQAGARLQIERDYIDAPLPEPYVGWTERVATLLHDARAAGELRSGVDPDEAAAFLVAAFFGLQHISEVLNHRKDIVKRWHAMRDLTFYSLRA
ncbi:ScbR family autoregulator-binding transcription factor [Kitasatospora mediocidica]|uniref:ScbR family autoregulator-binding transcription factor n=1 Tax=Kitasatospora mediocidica TaxID=58352 RepID=UPI00055ADABC|nr:ScbR family autoregulator-binding transcription factor [Kitasatospora mediocidica]